MYLHEAKNRKIEDVHKLQILYKDEYWREGIGQYIEVEEIEFYWWEKDPTMPPGIEKLKKLERIYFKYCQFTQIPEILAKLKQLKVLSFRLKCNLVLLPTWISNFTELEVLNLNENKIRELPLSIGALTKLKELHLYYNKLEELPKEFFQLQQLKILDLARNRLQKLPAFLGKFTQLEQFFVNSNALKQIPLSLKACTKMEIFHWHKNEIPAQRIIHILFHYPDLIIKKNYKKENLELANLAQAARQLNPEGGLLDQIIQLYLNQADKIQDLSDEILLKISRLRDRSNTARRAVQTLAKKHRDTLKKQAINKSSKIVISGKTNLKKAQIAEGLKTLKIHYQRKLNTETTHLVLGPANTLKIEEIEEILARKIIVLEEADFLQIYNDLTTPYLIEGAKEDPNQLQNIGALLLSKDESNHAIALEMIKSGGLPKDLITDLFIFYAFIANKKDRQKARKTLLLYGSEKLKTALRKKYQKLSSRSTDSLYDFTRDTELIQWKINQFVFLQLSYWYLHNQKNNLIADTFEQAPKEIAESFILQVFKKWSLPYKSLSWPWHLDFEQLGVHSYKLDYLESFLLALHEWSQYKIKKFPKGISKLQNLKILNLQFDMSSLDHEPPEEVFQLTKLKELNLHKSKIKYLPKELGNLKELETLNLSNNQLEEFPEAIFKLKKLKNIFLNKAFSPKLQTEQSIQKLKAQFPNAKIVT